MAITQKDILYGEIVYLQLYYKDVCKHMTVLNINTESWEDAVCLETTQVGEERNQTLTDKKESKVEGTVMCRQPHPHKQQQLTVFQVNDTTWPQVSTERAYYY